MYIYEYESHLGALEQATSGSDVFLLNLRGAVDDGSPRGARDAVVVRLADATDHRHVRLDQVVLSQVGNALQQKRLSRVNKI